MKKKLMTLALTAALTASAELPRDLQSQAVNTDATAFFLAMDKIEEEAPDGTTRVTYDAYTNGIKKLTRRIDLDYNSPGIAELTDYICQVFDSITGTPNVDRIVVNNSFGDNMCRVYKIKTNPYDNSVDMSDLTSINSSSAAAVVKQGDLITIAQSWIINTDLQLGAPDLTALNDRITLLMENNQATIFPTKHDYPNPQPNGVRIRKSDNPTNDSVEIMHITLYNTNVNNWINLHHQFMAYIGANANISLTYTRNERYVTIIDCDKKTIYAAKYSPTAIRNTGDLYIAMAKYTGQQPYIPSDWWVAVSPMQ